jgi:quinol monooxygenase YgiN
MSTPTDDRDLLTVFATMRAAPGKRAEVREALAALVSPTTAEDGCVTYDLHQGIDDPDTFHFYENWESAEALEAHSRAPHIAAFGARASDLLAEGPTVHRVERIA